MRNRQYSEYLTSHNKNILTGINTQDFKSVADKSEKPARLPKYSKRAGV